MSVASSYLGLLDRVVSKAVRLIDGLVVCDLEHRRRVAAFCMFHKIYCNPNHAKSVKKNRKICGHIRDHQKSREIPRN